MQAEKWNFLIKKTDMSMKRKTSVLQSTAIQSHTEESPSGKPEKEAGIKAAGRQINDMQQAQENRGIQPSMISTEKFISAKS